MSLVWFVSVCVSVFSFLFFSSLYAIHVYFGLQHCENGRRSVSNRSFMYDILGVAWEADLLYFDSD